MLLYEQIRDESKSNILNSWSWSRFIIAIPDTSDPGMSPAVAPGHESEVPQQEFEEIAAMLEAEKVDDEDADDGEQSTQSVWK